MIKKVIKIFSWISIGLMVVGFTIVLLAITLIRWNLPQEFRGDEPKGSEWAYWGAGLFALGGILQLIPIILGLIQQRLERDMHGEKSK
jgi:uncharacterized membrane protein